MATKKAPVKKKATRAKRTTKAHAAWKPASELAGLISEWEARLVAEGHTRETRWTYGKGEAAITLIYGAVESVPCVDIGEFLSRRRLRDAHADMQVLAAPYLEAFANAVREKSQIAKEEMENACAVVRRLLDVVPARLDGEPVNIPAAYVAPADAGEP